MTKVMVITGATDGLGLETAKMAAPLGHTLVLHGRNPKKLSAAAEAVSSMASVGEVQTYQADLSVLAEVRALADQIKGDFKSIDVLVNNAGVFKTPNPITHDGYDARFIVNAISPYLLTKALLPVIAADGRVVNLSSAAQAPVDVQAFLNKQPFSDSEAYAQSKLALTMWSMEMAKELGPNGPMIVAVNPASFLATKMAKEAYGRQGNDLRIGADILMRAAFSDEFAGTSGQYYDNDRQTFAAPHQDALNTSKRQELIRAIQHVI